MILILFCCLVKVNSGAFLFTAFTVYSGHLCKTRANPFLTQIVTDPP